MSLDQVLGQQHHPAVVSLIGAIEARRQSTVLTYFLLPGAAIADDVIVHFYDHLRRIGRQRQIDLFLNSLGGATEVPWRIVSLIREFTDRFCVLLPYQAASAATHISLGADEIVMTEVAQLGPVDPSRRHPLLPADPFVPADQPARPLAISVQDLRHFMQFIEKEGQDDVARPQDATPIYVELMRQVHPLVIGAMEQSYALAKLITKNMLALHMDPEAEAEAIEKLADHLADDFKSHVYPINRREAHEMGLKVTDADEPLRDAMWALWQHYTSNPPNLPNTPMPPKNTPAVLRPAAYVDSTAGAAIAVGLFDASKGDPVGEGWVSWYA